jgi:hypothetical protein
MAYVADGGKCVGFVLRRGRTGYEAFDAGEKSLGLFPSEADAAEVVLGKVETSTWSSPNTIPLAIPAG